MGLSVVAGTNRRTRSQPMSGKTAVVCGGSKGIGKATACEFVRQGGSVCVVARDPRALEEAREEIGGLVHNGAQFVETIACDTTDRAGLEPQLSEFVDRHGVPDYLLNLVGYAHPQYVDELSLDDFQQAMDVNYYGQLVPLLILLPHFMEVGKGHVANVSSVLGYMGVMGYATYAPTKYALVGLTEALRHELKPHGIRFSILFPPDTDTPGFEKENETKPPEWSVSDAPKLMSADDVARVFLDGLRKERFYILPGQASRLWRLSRMSPRLVHTVVDREYRSARKKLGKQ